MSFSSDIFNKKLSSLQETQESIVTISQWVLFHHKHCKDLADIWSSFILQSNQPSNKKLSLLYLCNDVVQQARHKRKGEFITEFGRVLPQVLNKIHNKLDRQIVPKVDRLINVWEQRNVFSLNDIKKFRKAIELSKANKPIPTESTELDRDEKTQISEDSVAPDLKQLNETYTHMNKLLDTSQSNLNQVGIQSKTYLPSKPGLSDNLPSPEIYISKLNTLEKLCNIAKKNIEDVKFDKAEIVKILNNLKSIIVDSTTIDDSKLNIINSKLEKLNSTRSMLIPLLHDENAYNNNNVEEEEASPAFDDGEEEETSPAYDDNEEEPSPNTHSASNTNNNDYDNDEDEDMIPTYENDNNESDDDDDDDDKPSLKRQKTSSSSSTPNNTPTPTSNSGNSTPSSKKSVAFSENIEIKEYDREEQTDVIKIVKSDDDNDINESIEDDEYLVESKTNIGENIDEFGKHHKDALELKHEQDNQTPKSNDNNQNSYSPYDDESYDPNHDNVEASESNSTSGLVNEEEESSNSAVLDLLSKLR